MHTWGELDIRARANCAYPAAAAGHHLPPPPSKMDMMYLGDHYPSPYPQYPHDYTSYKCDYSAMHKAADFTRSCAYDTMNLMAGGHGFDHYDNFSHLRMDPYGRGKSGRAKGRLLFVAHISMCHGPFLDPQILYMCLIWV